MKYSYAKISKIDFAPFARDGWTATAGDHTSGAAIITLRRDGSPVIHSEPDGSWRFFGWCVKLSGTVRAAREPFDQLERLEHFIAERLAEMTEAGGCVCERCGK